MRFVLILSCLIAVIADMSLVWWAKKETHPSIALVAGFILLNLSAFWWTKSLRLGIESAIGITFYALATVIGCSYLGVIIFKEQLSTTNSVGMVLGLIAIALLSWK